MSKIPQNFFFIALGASILALIEPQLFLWVKPFIPMLLGLIMFAMGLTLQTKEFKQVWEKRRLVLLGVLMQFLIMPLLAWGLSMVLRLDQALLIGMVLVGASPGGTASNVIVYLSKGNLPLSISLTFTSTLLAPLLTPLIIFLMLNESIELSYVQLLGSVLQLVALPLFLGLLGRYFLDKKAPQQFQDRLLASLPIWAVLFITLIIACVMALNQAKVLAFPGMTLLAVALHNGLGLVLSYQLAKLFTAQAADRRTLAIEVGMQNSGLAVTLANQFFGAGSTLPGAIFSLWHNLSGSLLAKFWGQSNPEKQEPRT